MTSGLESTGLNSCGMHGLSGSAACGILPGQGLNPCLLRRQGFPCSASGKEPTSQCRRHRRCGFDPWVWKIPWRRKWQPPPVFLLGESHGQRSLVGYSPWGRKELDMTKCAHTDTYPKKKRNLPLIISTSGSLFCDRHQTNQTHILFQAIFIGIIEFSLL